MPRIRNCQSYMWEDGLSSKYDAYVLQFQRQRGACTVERRVASSRESYGGECLSQCVFLAYFCRNRACMGSMQLGAPEGDIPQEPLIHFPSSFPDGST